MKKTILFQGDSVTDCGRSREEDIGPNVGLGAGYPSLIAARLLADFPADDIQVFNRGISGNRVVDLYARWKIDALNMKPDILSILIGVNDTWHEMARANGVEPKRYAKIYRELLTWTREVLPECNLVLCEPFVLDFGTVGSDWLGEMAARAEIVAELAREFNAVLVPCQTVINNAAKLATPEAVLRDGVHPLLRGHQFLADAWLKAVKERGWL